MMKLSLAAVAFTCLGLTRAQNPPNMANSTVPYDLPGTAKYNYAEVLHKSFLFYHAQRSGKLGQNRRLAWRGDSCFICTGPRGEDLSGGYYEAANTMKWGLPLAWTLSQLSFNIFMFGDAMKAVNEYKEAMESVKWGTDYLLNCITDKDNFVGQFGVSARNTTDVDFGYFGPPEEYEKWVPLGIQHPAGTAYINDTHRSSEILGESAAALASASIIFSSVDATYSARLLSAAKDLYTRGSTQLGTYMDSKDENMLTLKTWYPSTTYVDELAWAASWLYSATKEQAYLDAANTYIQNATDHGLEYSWDEKLPGAYVVLYMATKNETYKTGIETYMKNYYPGGAVKQTKLGLSYFYGWGSLRYASNTAFIMLSYAKIVGYKSTEGLKAVTFAAQQINYMLGDCGRSWVVGFGQQSPLRPYHKSSYNSYIDFPMRGQDNGAIGGDFLESNRTNTFILYGALVGGPVWDDTWFDNRAKYEYTEVTQDYNAAFTGVNAAMIDYYGHSSFKPFTDCGLDLGWGHPNATNPPSWPSDDCYHTCKTDCNYAASVSGASTGTSSPSPSQTGSKTTSGATVARKMMGVTTILTIAGGLLLLI